MTLLDRFRRSAPWEDPDPSVRAEAVRKIEDQALLTRIAGSDPDARVRRATLRRLNMPGAVAPLAHDADADVREEALEALTAFAMGKDAALAAIAVAALDDARRLSRLAKSAPLPAVRESALSRIGEARTLAVIAKTAEAPAIRLEALRRIDELSLVLDVATRSEHKDVAVAAVERLADPETLRSVASQARNKAASRRAEARLEAMLSTAGSADASEPDADPSEPRADASESQPVEAAPPAAESTQAAEESRGAMAAGEVSASSGAMQSVIEPPTHSKDEPPSGDLDGAKPESGASGAAESVVAEAVTAEPATAEPVINGTATEELRAEHLPTPDAAPQNEERRHKRVAQVEALCLRLEGLPTRPGLTLRDAETALRDSRSEPDDPAIVPARLAQRLKVARSVLFSRLQELREADEWSRWGNAAVQEELCKGMEALVAREDYERVAVELREADARWAQARYAPKDQARALRERYQAARAQVKARLDAYYAKRSEEGVKNLEEREALCVRAEALADSTDWLKASEELKALQAKWKGIGPAPRRQGQKLWKRFHAACDRFFTRRQEDLRRRKTEWAANLQSKQALCGQAEALLESSDWEATATEVRRLQGEWRRIGPVRRNRSEEVWGRFRRACDAFFDRYRRRDALDLESRLAEREQVSRELELLLPAEDGAQAPEGLAEAVLALQARMRQPPQLPAEQERSLAARFAAARDRLIEAFPDSFKGTDLDAQANRSRKEKLCARLEALLSTAGADDPGLLSGDALARRLKEALASNTIAGRSDAATRQRADAEEVEAAQVAWKRVGPVPGKLGAELEERFKSACARLVAR